MSEQLLAQLNSLIAKDVDGFHQRLNELSDYYESQIQQEGIDSSCPPLCWCQSDAEIPLKGTWFIVGDFVWEETKGVVGLYAKSIPLHVEETYYEFPIEYIPDGVLEQLIQALTAPVLSTQTLAAPVSPIQSLAKPIPPINDDDEEDADNDIKFALLVAVIVLLFLGLLFGKYLVGVDQKGMKIIFRLVIIIFLFFYLIKKYHKKNRQI